MTAPDTTPESSREDGRRDGHDLDGGRGHDDGSASVVLAEERLRTAVVREPVQRVRLRREVVTEEIMVPVTVRREVLRIETQEIPRGGRAPSAPGDREPFEIVLHEERPMVTLETVAVERVRVEVVEVSGTQHVEADLAVEQVEVDQMDARDR